MKIAGAVLALLLVSTAASVIAYQLLSNRLTGQFIVVDNTPFKAEVITAWNGTVTQDYWMPFTTRVTNEGDAEITGNVRIRVEVNAPAGYGLNASTVELQCNHMPLPATMWVPVAANIVNASDVYWESTLNGGTVPGHWTNDVNMQIMFHDGLPTNTPLNYVITIVKD